MDSSSDTDVEQQTSSGIFRAILEMFFFQGLGQGGKYGALYGMCYGIFPYFVFGAACGFGVGLIYGVIVGAVMGIVNGCVLGLFSVVWYRRMRPAQKERHSADHQRFRRGFIGLVVVLTTLGSSILFPVVLQWVPPGAWENTVLSYLFLDFVPTLIAGYAAFKSGQKVFSWHENNMAFPKSLSALPERIWKMPPIRPED